MALLTGPIVTSLAPHVLHPVTGKHLSGVTDARDVSFIKAIQCNVQKTSSANYVILKY